MFCKYCGKSLPDDAAFCSGCGQHLVQGQPARPSPQPAPAASLNTVLFTLRPEFIALVVLGRSLLYGLIAGVFGLGITAVIIGEKTPDPIKRNTYQVHLDSWTPVFVVALFIFIGIVILSFVLTMRAYESTVYRFYADRVEYMAGFFGLQKKMVKYKNITEVNLKQNIVQRSCGIGSLVLLTPGSTSWYSSGRDSDSGNRSFGGVWITDVSRPDQVYEQIRNLVQQAS